MKFANPSKKSRTIASIKGHAIEFPGKTADGPVFVMVPPSLRAEVMAAGMIPESEIEEEKEDALPTPPSEPSERVAALHKVYGQLVERGARDDFAGNGSPKVEAIAKVLGWKPDAKENRDAWLAYQTGGKD